MWSTKADPASRLLFSASGGSPDLLYIGALKSKDGKEILSIKSPGIEELQKLGYTGSLDHLKNLNGSVEFSEKKMLRQLEASRAEHRI
jgi:hypothetical protein